MFTNWVDAEIVFYLYNESWEIDCWETECTRAKLAFGGKGNVLYLD